MNFNYFKIALRVTSKQKAYSLINLLGFTISITCCLLILIYVLHELSYDRYHEKSDRIYRVTFGGKLSESHTFLTALSSSPIAAEFEKIFPGVETATRFSTMDQKVIQIEDKIFNQDHLLYAEQSFFDVFDFEVLIGDPSALLNEPNTMVLTRETAERYFGSQAVVGQMIKVGDIDTPFKVTGVVNDVPENSHFTFDALLSGVNTYSFTRTDWLNLLLYTYIVLKPGHTIEELEAKMPSIQTTHFSPIIQKAMNLSWEDFLNKGNEFKISFQPLTQIHLFSHREDELKTNGNITNLYIFSIIALFILLIACINYMNLSTARSTQRAKEVGIRKTLGAVRSVLAGQFLAESMIFVFAAMLLSVGLVELLLPLFRSVSGVNISVNLFSYWWFPLALISFAILTGFLAGVFAFILASPAAYYGISKWYNNFAYRANIDLLTFILAGITAILLVVITVGSQAVKAAGSSPAKTLRYE